VLAAGQHGAALRVPERHQLAGLLRPAVGTGFVALEGQRQIGVGQQLTRDALAIELIRLTALARAVALAGAVRAHVAHVMAAADQKSGGVPAPGTDALHAPADNRPVLTGPRLQRSMAVAGDLEVLDRDDHAAPIDDRRRERVLVRIDPNPAALDGCTRPRPPLPLPLPLSHLIAS
jgi:hypothetical protein